MGPIILVDSNPATREVLAGAIAASGLPVLAFESWEDARGEMAVNPPAAVVLTDWKGRGGRGNHRRLRYLARGAPFVLVGDGGVTAWDERFATVLAYPASAEELRGAIRDAISASTETMCLGDLRLDTRSRLLRRGAKSVSLTAIQASLLGALMVAGGALVSSAELSEAGWPGQEVEDRRVLYTHLAWLRARLKAFAPSAVIENVRGEGYRLVVRRPSGRLVVRADE